MARHTRLLTFLVLLAGLTRPERALAQTPTTGPDPSTITLPKGEVDVLPGFPRPPDAPRSLLLESGSQPYSCQPLPDYFERDPRLDPCPLPAPGWFYGTESGIVVPHVKNGLTDSVQVPGRALPELVQIPAANLDWTVAPRFELGYRLPSGFGQVSLAYRFLVSQGDGLASGTDAPAALRSRLDLNMADLDYASNEMSLWPSWSMKWRVGIRGADVFFDSRANESFAAAAAGSGIYETRTTNNFWGIGPHAGLELQGRPGQTGFSLLGSVDAATLLGRVGQTFIEESLGNGQPTQGFTRRTDGQDVPMITAFLGVGWQPTYYPHIHFSAGYQYEYWWNVGRMSSTASRGELSDQGVLLRSEFNW